MSLNLIRRLEALIKGNWALIGTVVALILSGAGLVFGYGQHTRLNQMKKLATRKDLLAPGKAKNLERGIK